MTTSRAERGPAGVRSQTGRRARLTQSVMLSPELRQRLRVWAAFRGVEISELVEEAVARRLGELDREREARGLPPIPRPDA